MMEFDTSFSDGQFKKTADNSKLISLCENLEFTSLEKGLQNSIQWFINNFKTCRI